MITVLFFLSSGLFLGWSLGANDAANVFGTAVGTKMVKFRTAAIICSIFVILGAVISGAGASHTLGKLGSINALGGSFTVAFSAAFTVFVMTKLKLPVSTSQAIVGAIVGWNFFAGALTDFNSLSKIISTWVICPLLSGFFAVLFYNITKQILKHVGIHMLRLDSYTRLALILAGAFGSYSLGANNIANVMGVFVPVSPFKDLSISGITMTSVQQLFLLGGLAIAVGVFTYSWKVMGTVGNEIFKLSPIAAFIVVLSSSTVLFLFASQDLKAWLVTHHLPSFPLVPVSSSQAVVGAVIGIGLARGGGKNINFGVLRNISLGWITTPLLSGLISFVLLFIMQNVFMQQTFKPIEYEITPPVINELQIAKIDTSNLKILLNKKFDNAVKFQNALHKNKISSDFYKKIFKYSEIGNFYIDPKLVNNDKFGEGWLTKEQINAIKSISGNKFHYKWQLEKALSERSKDWRYKPNNEVNVKYNKKLKETYKFLFRVFSSDNRNK